MANTVLMMLHERPYGDAPRRTARTTDLVHMTDPAAATTLPARTTHSAAATAATNGAVTAPSPVQTATAPTLTACSPTQDQPAPAGGLWQPPTAPSLTG